MTMFARARAEENRVFVACAAAPTCDGRDDDRRPARAAARARRWRGASFRSAADVNRALSHQKQRAPGTDVVRNRQPATYGAITRTRAAAGRVL